MLLGEAELLLPVEAGVADDRLDAVVEEEVGEQEEHRLRVEPQLAEGGRELLEAAADDTGLAVDGRAHRSGEVGQAADRDDGEAGPPQARHEQADPRRHDRVEAELLLEGQHREVDRQQESAAEVAQCPALGGDPVALVLVRDAVEDRVVDDQGRAEAEAGHDGQDDTELPVRPGDEEHEAGGEGTGPRESREEPGGPRAAVGDGADEHEEQSGHDRREGHGVGVDRAGGRWGCPGRRGWWCRRCRPRCPGTRSGWRRG